MSEGSMGRELNGRIKGLSECRKTIQVSEKNV